MKFVQWIDRIDDASAWGAEAFDLGAASRTGVPVLPGFAVSTALLHAFMTQAPVRRKIEKARAGLDLADAHLFAGVAQEIRETILAEPFGKEIRDELHGYLKLLKDRLVKPGSASLPLFVRTQVGSAYAADYAAAVRTVADLEKLIKRAYAATFSQEALFERYHYEHAIVPPQFPLIVHYDEQPDASGEAYCRDLATHDDTTITIRAVHFGKATDLQEEDVFTIDKKTLLLLGKSHAEHWWAEQGGRAVAPKHAGKRHPSLEDEAVLRLARSVRTAQAAFDDVMAFEWALIDGQFWLAGVSPLDEAPEQRPEVPSSRLPQPILLGFPGTAGWVSGPVRVIRRAAERQTLQKGDIAVVEQLTTQDYEWLYGVAGLIVEHGLPGGNEAVVAQYLGVPAVFAANEAASHLKNGQVVTLDGSYGAVYAGAYPANDHARPQHVASLPITGTKIYATVLDPQGLTRGDLEHADGIGLLRSEFLLKLLGVHPQDIVRKGLADEYVAILADEIEAALRLVYPRPVVYQLHDIASVELLGYREKHHDRFEPNPAIGYRGTHRLLNEPDVLDLELAALAKVAAKGLENFAIMLPMTRSLDEVAQMQDYLDQSDLATIHLPRLWVKCETPAMAILAEDLCKMRIEGLCIDVPSLAQLTLGIDRSNMQMAHHLNEADQALEDSIRYAIATCHHYGVPSMLVAEMADLRPETVQAGIESGLTAISVAPSRVIEAHGMVASIEQRIILDRLAKDRTPES